MTKKIVLFIAIDQITKLIFSSRDFFMGPLHIHEVKNYGLSFSLNFGGAVNLFLVVLGFILFGIYFWKHSSDMNSKEKLAMGLVLSGATGNIADRLILGYVRDFIDIGLGFTFNFADVFVLIGIIILLTQPRRQMIG